MPADVEVAAVVEVPAVTPEAGVHVPDAQMAMHVNVPAMKVMDPVRKVDPVSMDPVGSMHAVRDVGAVHAVAAMTADAVMATTTAVRARIGTGGREGRNADNGRRDESEKSRMFEHGRRPFGSMWAIRILVEASTRPVQAIDFQCVFVHLTFIDGAAVWQSGDSARIAIVCGPA